MAAASDPVVCDGQVEDQAAVPCRVLEIALDFHVAAPLACAGRHLVLRADRVSICPKRVCVFYYCRTYYKAVRVGGGGEWRTCAMRDDEPRPVWMSLPITH